MLDIKVLRSDMETVRARLAHRGEDISGLDSIMQLDKDRRRYLQETEELKSRRNTVSKEIAQKKKAGEDASESILEMRTVGDRIKELDGHLRQVEESLHKTLLTLPNIPHESVPVGASEEENVPVRHWGKPRSFTFEAKPHWDLAKELDLLDFERAAKVTGSRFVFYKGLGARLERALMNFMLDLHTGEHGYTEMIPPYMVNRTSMTGTGQLPKFAEDAFAVEGTEYFLIPTSEVPVTNFHGDEILNAKDLPKKFAAYSANFRSEAGSAGRDTRGLIRTHQFNKIELVKMVRPEDSYNELDSLVENAEKVLQLLGLPYQVLMMCTADLGFTAAKKYDLEVWLPSSDTYREISSCSNFEDFQARRANIRFRREVGSKPEFIHTLNGSGLAIGRTVAALIENYQQEDGSILIPEVLRPYLGGLEKITKD
ncbi:serine--tRNA ligase [Marininema halotolerans]|uniref:Serine--tRNA ligase n=1 Tax=Marininema halotolerans TaxID=1155944 RepID=A0A1I6PC21_9BACL|nr:serine--tRNA ligase [Marininema halotolerans]SFS37723.1 seryl-tRNA synthetase [Marininema halotolerans]